MNEIKIRFKSGDIGYFKLIDDTDEYIQNIYNYITLAIREEMKGTFEVIDLTDDKKTSININEIASIGYSKIE